MCTPVLVSATGAVKTIAGYIHALSFAAGSAAAGSAVINDSEDGTGTDKWKLAAGQAQGDSVSFDPPIFFENGIYVTLAGTGATLSVAYE